MAVSTFLATYEVKYHLKPMGTARTSKEGSEPSGLADTRSARLGEAAPNMNSELRSNGIDPDRARKFTSFAWLVLIYNIVVVGWGVFVRAGKYGDGCGNHWPLCGPTTTPLMGHIATIIEASHRISTSITGPLALALVVTAFRAFPKKHIVRKAAVLTMAFTILEGLVGAALVLYGWVTVDDSAARAAVMAFHVISTFLLLGCIAAALVGSTMPQSPKLRGQGTAAAVVGMAALGVILLGVSGAISALGHQLRPTDHVLQAALNPATFWMVRLQPLHPLIAASVGLYLLLTAGLMQHLRPDPKVKKASEWMLVVYGIQVAVGALNIFLKAPIEMQMVHLVVADINWLTIVALAMAAFAPHVERVEDRPAPEDLEVINDTSFRAKVRAYVALTKPRVISLLLFTCMASMVAAKGQWPGLIPFLAVALGGYMAAGAANAINMVIDRDIDYAMKRTATRPTVTQIISSQDALLFAFVLASGSFAILWSVANLLSAVLAFSGLVFYVVVYTLLLKRRTWHNIVIGGAAGAVPPLVGWAAVTNSLPPLALYLFAIVFVWTPVHFWALALMLKDDYQAAGVPMLPVVKGERTTVVQIALYTLVTCVVTLLPWLLPQVGPVGFIYVVGAMLLNVMLIKLCVGLYRQIDRPHASSLFHYSMLYLALLFLVFAVDRTVVMG